MEQIISSRFHMPSLKNNQTRILGFGYNDFDSATGKRSLRGDGENGKDLCDFICSVLKPQKNVGLWNCDCIEPIIAEEMRKISLDSEENETSIFCYFGHGREDFLDLPDFESEKKDKLRPFYKKDFFDLVSKIKGRKLVILSCCYGDYHQIPENTLLVTPSKRNTGAYTDCFHMRLVFDLFNSKEQSSPLDHLFYTLLTKYHNFPFGPLNGPWIHNSGDKLDKEVYEEEKNTNTEIFKGYQRANVRSTLIENGIHLDVDPKCNFLK